MIVTREFDALVRAFAPVRQVDKDRFVVELFELVRHARYDALREGANVANALGKEFWLQLNHIEIGGSEYMVEEDVVSAANIHGHLSAASAIEGRLNILARNVYGRFLEESEKMYDWPWTET